MPDLVSWTEIGDGTDLFSLTILNELVTNYNLCWAIEPWGGDNDIQPWRAGDDVQDNSQDPSFWTLQYYLDAYLTSHSGVSAWDWRAAVAWDPAVDDWTDPSDPMFASPRRIQAGDIIGPWIIVDIQEAITYWATLL